jgi:3'(2'), 5'-bisphosphate nucleotidase
VVNREHGRRIGARAAILSDLPVPVAVEHGRPGKAETLSDFHLDAMARALAEIALLAGPVVMEEYARGAQARDKADGSPVTAADERAEAIILAELKRLAPDVAVVAEEACAAGAALVAPERFFLVDPLDGTREFVAGNGEFTVNIGLIENGAPVAGAVYAPALDRIWFGARSAYAARVGVGGRLPQTCETLRVRAPQALTALASRSHADPATEAFLSRLGVAERISAGSSLKFCAIAEGRADVYPRFAPTMEWDTAAGDAVLRAAGGGVVALDGAELKYGKLDQSLRNAGFVGFGDPALRLRVVNAL